jgi:hypothetical protein
MYRSFVQRLREPFPSSSRSNDNGTISPFPTCPEVHRALVAIKKEMEA